MISLKFARLSVTRVKTIKCQYAITNPQADEKINVKFLIIFLLKFNSNHQWWRN